MVSVYGVESVLILPILAEMAVPTMTVSERIRTGYYCVHIVAEHVSTNAMLVYSCDDDERGIDCKCCGREASEWRTVEGMKERKLIRFRVLYPH